MATVEIKARNSPLSFFVSSQDFDLISDYVWYINNDKYVVRFGKEYDENGKYKFKTYLLHREIMKRKEPNIDSTNLQCDHIDNNTLNNTRENLRYVTTSENSKKRTKKYKYYYTGVRRSGNESEKAKKWRAYINIKKDRYNVGFDTFQEAFIWRILMEFWRDYLKTHELNL